MQRMPARDGAGRPKPQQASRSFSRYEPSSSPSTSRSRANSNQESQTPVTESPVQTQAFQADPDRSHSDIFDTQDDANSPRDTDVEGDDTSQDDFEALPIEIRSLVERFLESLPLKTQPSSFSIDSLAELCQEFYIHVQSHIATHIAALQTKLSREKSPAPSVSSVSSAASRSGIRRNPRGSTKDSEQQMLTALEVADRKKARRQIELKRLWMEEAVERRVCEHGYSLIWRNSSTDDESRDAKLRSRAAALSLVGVDLKELLSTSLSKSEAKSSEQPSTTLKADPAYIQLKEARKALEQMNRSRHPQGKLQALSTTHKEIVDALQKLFPSSSSADEILPTLIYVVITSHPESINLVSDLFFIQRFRNASKLGGEAAYCLTNLEAAVGFLETVDLSSIRSSELPEGPPKGSSSGSRPSTPRSETVPQDPLYRGLPASPPQQSHSPNASTSSKHTRRLSSLIGGRPQPLPGAVITQADNAIDAIHTALDNSFQFLFGRIKEKQLAQDPGEAPEIVAPKTLEDARRLVSEKPDNEVSGEVENMSEPSDDQRRPLKDSDMLTLIGGRRAPRDGSVGSAQSDTSAGRKGQPTTGNSTAAVQRTESTLSSSGTGSGTTTATTVASGYAAVESMRNIGDSLNPFKSFGIRGFGRPANIPSPPPNPAAAVSGESIVNEPNDAKSNATEASTDEAAHGLKMDLSGIGPPIDRFVGVKDARELNYFDVELLLRDYQRLAGVVRMLQS